MSVVRLGAVGYLNARPLVYGLDSDPRFAVRYDLPSTCARLLHEGAIDLGLIPSIEYLRGPRPYSIVPGPAVVSRGPVASVALYTRRDPRDIRTVAMDTSSRTSVALATVLLRRVFNAAPQAMDMAPALEAMLARADAALVIGDVALLLDHDAAGVQKIDLGELWTKSTGLPFVYAFWAGHPDALTPENAARLVRARDEGIVHIDEIAAVYFDGDAARQGIARRYLRDNIHYALETDALSLFYRYAAELDLVKYDGKLRFYDVDRSSAGR